MPAGTRENVITERITLWGIVQGVGFRPFAAKLADRMGIRGEVLNKGGLVEITVTDAPERIDAFCKALEAEKPGPSEIVHIRREKTAPRDFGAFTIVGSDAGDDEAAMLPADLAICPDCLREMLDPADPRYLHPFISCMACGPRYTITDRMPYDRDNTSMIDFPMCGMCAEQYADRSARRYHAQTISCHDCGPVIEVMPRGGVMPRGEVMPRGAEAGNESGISAAERGAEAAGYPAGTAARELARKYGVECGTKIYEQVIRPLALAKALLDGGQVIAVKCVGGYNLVCDARSETAVALLREIKGRESKPFAVMFRDMEQVRRFCEAGPVEEKLLASSARPIILLERRAEACGDGAGAGDGTNGAEADRRAAADGVAAAGNDTRYTGAFLPSMGLQYLMLDACGYPLIFTSANVSDMPMIKDDGAMFAFMRREPMISAAFYNMRDIRARADDSVARVIDGQPQMIRRSKGYAPVPVYIEAGDSARAAAREGSPSAEAGTGRPLQLLACGGQLKNSFCLTKGPFAYMSRYFGDMDSADNIEDYETDVERMKALFRTEPDAVVCDMHPGYAPTAFAKRYASERGLPLIEVQHHHAHAASVMAEHGLTGPAIGVCFDGTGYGTDGAVWGGEFLICEGAEFSRAAHLRYVRMLGGDSSMKEAWKSALCWEYALENADCGRTEGRETAAAGKCAESDGERAREVMPELSRILEYAKKREAEGRAEYGRMKAARPVVRAAIKSGVNCIESSSMGRLFDAVSAMLGIKDYNDYEGQCAMMLEEAAARGMRTPGASEADDLAYAFHRGIARMILDTCEEIRGARDCGGEAVRAGTAQSEPTVSGTDTVVLSGGTFQNRVLMDETLALLRQAGFRVYYNVSVSPNDGGIALGQAYIGMKRLAESRGAEE